MKLLIPLLFFSLPMFGQCIEVIHITQDTTWEKGIEIEGRLMIVGNGHTITCEGCDPVFSGDAEINLCLDNVKFRGYKVFARTEENEYVKAPKRHRADD